MVSQHLLISSSDGLSAGDVSRARRFPPLLPRESCLAALLVVPCLVTNVWQYAAGPAAGTTMRRFVTMMLDVQLR